MSDYSSSAEGSSELEIVFADVAKVSHSPPRSPLSLHSHDDLSSIEKEWYEEVRETVLNLAPKLQEISDQIFENPELGGKEHLACRLLNEELSRNGFQIETNPAGLETAFVATYESSEFNESSRVIAFFTEYDALPDIGHACGHHLIAVGAIASAVATKSVMEKMDLHGIVQVIGSPDEEGSGGKIELINAGYVKYPDVCLIAHPGNQDNAFMRTSALQGVTAHYYGKAAHAAINPWEGMNALDAVVQGYQAIAMYRQQMFPNTQVHGVISDGGSRANVIPKHASASYELRAETKAGLAQFKSKITDVFEGVVQSTGCQLRLLWDSMFAEMRTNALLASQYQRYMEALYDVEFATQEKQQAKVIASTDMGNVSHVKPSIHPMYSIGIDDTCSLHTKAFRTACQAPAAHERTWRAAVGLAMVALKVLSDDNYFERVLENFNTNE
ncbi:hypothetical protein IWQ62_003163 [Dispira parvispora]|uniref:Peptidase M20 domain-containing protein 2 n=1 Tax=Dispira parvispora TaxID=1520584 RepID=A0A9W8AVC2_9FUNG|nr:hypothetical protein IWQ62_003163 [Dispira parvispora]